MQPFHIPVLLEAAADSLRCRRGGVYIDGTIGGGGHACEILRRITPEGFLIGLDVDEEAIATSEERLRSFGDRKILLRRNFSEIREILAELHIEKVDGILIDLGVSSHQLDTSGRGFSFALNGPLDMRMDNRRGMNAFDLVNSLSDDALKKILRDYGEEKMAGRIVKAVMAHRAKDPIRTTAELARLVAGALPAAGKKRKNHPATKTFQAVRIAVNDELKHLRQVIKQGIDLLHAGGRFSVISFHSLEDRIVKEAFRSGEKSCTCPPDLPICACGKKPTLQVITRKPIQAGTTEVSRNPRARSARLRTAERI